MDAYGTQVSTFTGHVGAGYDDKERTLVDIYSISHTFVAVHKWMTQSLSLIHIYNFVFAVMIILFTYFYTAITINPTQMAEDMKRNHGFIPGIKRGKKTAEYIDCLLYTSRCV